MRIASHSIAKSSHMGVTLTADEARGIDPVFVDCAARLPADVPQTEMLVRYGIQHPDRKALLWNVTLCEDADIAADSGVLLELEIVEHEGGHAFQCKATPRGESYFMPVTYTYPCTEHALKIRKHRDFVLRALRELLAAELTGYLGKPVKVASSEKTIVPKAPAPTADEWKEVGVTEGTVATSDAPATQEPAPKPKAKKHVALKVVAPPAPEASSAFHDALFPANVTSVALTAAQAIVPKAKTPKAKTPKAPKAKTAPVEVDTTEADEAAACA
jgi:hypothetical protein